MLRGGRRSRQNQRKSRKQRRSSARDSRVARNPANSVSSAVVRDSSADPQTAPQLNYLFDLNNHY